VELQQGFARSMARTILLVEDDEPVLGLMATALTKQGHQIFKAHDADEAEKEWTEPGRAFDLLVTDVHLATPEDGFALAQKFLEVHPNVPVIFVSGDRDCFSLPSIRMFGDSPFIPKPFDIKKLLGAVDKLLNQPKGA
jgi:two-component system nitrogen regulation response regulator GlnG